MGFITNIVTTSMLLLAVVHAALASPVPLLEQEHREHQALKRDLNDVSYGVYPPGPWSHPADVLVMLDAVQNRIIDKLDELYKKQRQESQEIEKRIKEQLEHLQH